ncbi:putative MFS family arabinose efflux permease [Leucobacter komagatae]|uniref:Putative MFS family arabinose efflux permease n=1 Tax=Leucobacter komagatae TaxID=55969 RepID=A0A542Y8S7_9MICO|nr:MFS transporter [Leucobacter komagatae]TQL44481.1 putative MFS family arabinose efflux permease [Leucobacter komagatae]
MTAAPITDHSKRERRRVTAATLIGTTIEWYDYFVYAAMAGLLFGDLFFKGAGPEFKSVITFATVGVSFLFRPLGAIIAGHIGDRFGRRVALMITLITMGVATALIGLLPTYDAIGIAAPILLLTLRVLQGLSAGGEWGGAALLAVEHAPAGQRGVFGAAPQLGVPAGMVLASGIMALMTGVISPGDAFQEWGWRVPFLLSVFLIVVGYLVRRSVEESPVFTEIAERKAQTKAPLKELFRKHWRLVILAALTFIGMNATGYLTTGGFIQKYATDDPLNMDTTFVLLAVLGAAIAQLLFTWWAGALSDKIGRRTTYLIGWVLLAATMFMLFPLVNTGKPGMLLLGLLIMTPGLGMTYGPQPAWFAELFPASVRFSGVSVTYALGSILGGAFSPMISQVLLERTGSANAIAYYLVGTMVIAFIATLLLKDRSGIDLGMDNEEEQLRSPIYSLRKRAQA